MPSSRRSATVAVKRGAQHTDDGPSTGHASGSSGGAAGPRGGRRGLSTLSRVWLVLSTLLVLGLGLTLLAVQTSLLPTLRNPFETETTDRTGPALLKSIRDMSRYQAASGTFQVVVDLDQDTRFVPDAVRGERTLFVGTGSVGAYVELGGLGEDAVTVTEDRTGATVRLPRARLADPALNADRSYVVARERGLLDRFGDLFSDNSANEQQVRKLAVEHIGEAARESDLLKRAEANTRNMMENLLGALGFTRTTVTFAEDSGGN